MRFLGANKKGLIRQGSNTRKTIVDLLSNHGAKQG